MNNNLVIFSQDIIPVYTTETGEKVVIGRELHEKLKIETPYHKWFPRMCEYGFTDKQDYFEVSDNFVQNPLGGRPAVNHILTLEMAKHIAMIQRTPQGKAIRDKLIELETDVSSLSPELRLLINMELRQKQQEKALEETNRKLDSISEVVKLDSNSWCADARNLIIQIAHRMGGNEYIEEVNRSIYKLVNQRGGMDLERRLTFKRQRMADEGVSKSKRDKVSKLDVIAEDKKAVEIYIAIVKEMAIKHGVWKEDHTA